MKTTVPTVRSATGKLSVLGRRRLLSLPREPLFFADWDRAFFLHFEVDPDRLQQDVPFHLDLHDGGRAFVSLVAFTLRDMRLRFGGRLGALAFKSIATHPFLNVRTYVRHRGEGGIIFLAEWLPNRLACLLGPPVFGLPYRLGNLEYRHDHEAAVITGTVRSSERRPLLEYRGTIDLDANLWTCAAGSLDEFVLERYTAFTARRHRRGFFRVWHEPWPLLDVSVEVTRNDLLRLAPGGPAWARDAVPIQTHYSPGVRNVWMGRPHGLPGPISPNLNRI